MGVCLTYRLTTLPETGRMDMDMDMDMENGYGYGAKDKGEGVSKSGIRLRDKQWMVSDPCGFCNRT
jgi:hypothetical protein